MTNKDWLALAIITLLVSVVWTVFDIHHVNVTSTLTPTQEKLIEPLDPNLNTEVFDRINSRED